MAIVHNGNLQIRGTLTANSLLFKEMVDTSEMTRGANVDLVTGRMYYKIDGNNIFQFYTKEEIDDILSNFVPSQSGESTDVYIEPENYELFNLLNSTLFSICDSTKSNLININFDFSNDIVKATYSIDKLNSIVYKNGIINTAEYWVSPILSMVSYRNGSVLDDFTCVRFDNSATNSLDQTVIDSIYLNNILEWSASDVSALLDILLYYSVNDNTVSIDASNYLYQKLFSLN